MNYLPYFVARHAAMDLDRQGRPPGRLLLVLVGIGSLATLGLAALMVAGIGYAALGAFGLYH